MWLDCIGLFPLILYGLERLAEGCGGLFYCLMLGLSVWCNYYISMMVCMFLAFYFPVYLAFSGKRGKEFGKAAVSFAGYSILAAGLSAVLLFPEMETIQIAGSGDNPFPQTAEFYFGIKDLLYRHLIFAPPTGLTEWGVHLPNLYCGAGETRKKPDIW